MGIIDSFKKTMEQNKLYKQLKKAPHEELLKAIETNPESYNVVIKVLHNKATKLDEEWMDASEAMDGGRKKDYVKNKYMEFRLQVDECFSAIIERAPEYIEKASNFSKNHFDKFDIRLSQNALKSIPPFEKSDSALLIFTHDSTYKDYLCEALKKDKTLVQKAFDFIKATEKGPDFCVPIAQTIMETNPDMADKFMPLLAEEKFNETLYGNSALTHSMLKAKPELASEIMAQGYGKDQAALENPQAYLEYISKHTDEIISSADTEYYNLLTVMGKHPEFADKCVGLLKSLPDEQKQAVNDDLNRILEAKGFTYYRKHTDVPATFFTLLKEDNSYLQFTNPENISLKLMQDIAEDHPEMRAEINHFIVDKFCKEDKIDINQCNDLVIVSKALNEMIKSGDVSHEDGMKYANKLAATEPHYIVEKPKWDYHGADDTQDDEWEEGCWRAEYAANIEHNKTNKETLKDNFGEIYSSLAAMQHGKDKGNDNADISEFVTSKISLLRAVVAPNVSKDKHVVNERMSNLEKQKRLQAAIQTLQSVQIKDITD